MPHPKPSRRPNVKIIVCEHAPRWAVLLRALEKPWPIVEARGLRLADEALRKHTEQDARRAQSTQHADIDVQVVVVSLADVPPAAALSRVAFWTSREPAPVVVVAREPSGPSVTDDGSGEFDEWIWREAGAAEVLSRPTDIRKLDRILARLCPRGPATAIESLRDELFARLPPDEAACRPTKSVADP